MAEKLYFCVYDDGFASCEYDGDRYVADITPSGTMIISIEKLDGVRISDHVNCIRETCRALARDYLMNISDYEFDDVEISYNDNAIFIWPLEENYDYYLGHIDSTGKFIDC